MYYITVSNGLLDPKHREKISTAVWEFMWMLDKMTSYNEQGVGKVLGGKPIKLEEIADQLGVTKKTVSRNLNRLEKYGYIKRIRTPYGYSFRVYKAKKVFKRRVDKNVRSDDREGTKMSDLNRVDKNVRNKEDNTVDNTVKTTSSKAAINPLIELFREVNPTYENLFKNKTQRKALENLVKKFGKEKVEEIIKVLPITNSKIYAPTITTPYQLEKDLGKLMAYVKKEKSNKKGKKILV